MCVSPYSLIRLYIPVIISEIVCRLLSNDSFEGQAAVPSLPGMTVRGSLLQVDPSAEVDSMAINIANIIIAMVNDIPAAKTQFVTSVTLMAESRIGQCHSLI